MWEVAGWALAIWALLMAIGFRWAERGEPDA